MHPLVNPAGEAAPPAGRVMCPDSVGRTLLEMAVPPDERRGDGLARVPVLGRRGELPEELRRAALAADAAEDALPETQVGQVDAEAVARWITGHHRSPSYPAVVLGSPHGAALHLAAALGAAWLPASFTVTVPWPGGSPENWQAAREYGTRLAQRLMAGNPGVSVRQVHDPVLRGSLCGATVSLHVRWCTLPGAYRSFLRERLVPGGASILVRDLRTWPMLGGPPGYTFQIGTPTSGWTANDHRGDSDAFIRLLHTIGGADWTDPPEGRPLHYAETSGEPDLEPELLEFAAKTGTAGHRMLYNDPQAFSAAVADLYRSRLRPRHGDGHALVTAGRMIDPWQVLDAGLVPYWCESSSRAAAEAAELWLAGNPPFERVSVLPDPSGTRHGRLASSAHWRSIARFGRGGGMVDGLVAGRYPMLPAAAGHASRFVRQAAPASPRPDPIPVAACVRHLARGSLPGLVVA
ncbi:hypothetical protein [Actinoplanes sp. NPDC023714]|uniref:hypothetical protein n=1 Tax=Actinoplanes sp. NPDC023714 TaxID=3154322 RepID=UPI0033CB0FDD